MMRLRFFNLIEITMAIAVVGIGIGGVMALFPPAIEANKVANNKNFLSITSEMFMGYLETQILSNWTKTNSIPENKYTPTPADVPEPETESKMNRELASKGFPGLYTIHETADKCVFFIESADEGISAFISLWRTPSTDSDFCRVFIEVSWPAKYPYEQRDKQVYVYDVFKSLTE